MAGWALTGAGRRGFVAARVAHGHPRSLAALIVGIVSYVLLGQFVANPARGIAAWDLAASSFLFLIAWMVLDERLDRIAADAARQQEGEWVVFFVSIAATVVSFAAIVAEFSAIKGASDGSKTYHVALVGMTLVVSWLTSQTIFALRYAHEFYTSTDGSGRPDRGLEFPGEPRPDYLDFGYFALVLGMTFQVSDVQITSRKFRRVAAMQGLLGFLFNTIIIALTVNIASSLLS